MPGSGQLDLREAQDLPSLKGGPVLLRQPEKPPWVRFPRGEEERAVGVGQVGPVGLQGGGGLQDETRVALPEEIEFETLSCPS